MYKTLKFPHGEVRFVDCVEGMKELPPDSFDLCLTDPPYGIGYINKNRHRDGKDYRVWSKPIKNDGSGDIFTGWIGAIARIVTGAIFCFSTHLNYPSWRGEIEKYFTYKNTVIWDKGNHTMGNLKGNLAPCYEMIIVGSKEMHLESQIDRMKNLVHVPREGYVPESNPGFPVKPVSLLRAIVSRYGKKVIDPFLGTGSTGAACEELGVQWLGFEVDNTMKPDIENRINEGVEKRRISTGQMDKYV